MSKFNVFDDWGNKVGEFIPSGEDGAGLFGCLFIVVLFVVGLPLYFLGWLIDKGFAAAKEGNKEEALLYWALPIALVVCLGGVLLNNEANTTAQRQKAVLAEQQRQQEATVELRATEQAKATQEARSQEVEAEIKWTTEHPNEAIEIRRIGTISGKNLPFPKAGDGWWQRVVENSTYGQYEITSHTRYVTLSLGNSSSHKTGGDCVIEDEYLKPGNSATAYCVEVRPEGRPEGRVHYCWQFSEYVEGGYTGRQSCLAIPFP